MTTTLHHPCGPAAYPPPCDLLRQALDAGLSPCAYTLFAAIVLRESATDWASCSALAEVGGLSNYQARQPLNELVRVGLLSRRRERGRRGPGLPKTTLIDYCIPAKGRS